MEALGVQKHPVHGALKIELLWWLRGYWNKVSSFGGGRGGLYLHYHDRGAIGGEDF